MEEESVWDRIDRLGARTKDGDVDAAAELVELVERGEPSVRLKAARAVDGQHLPTELRRRLAQLWFEEIGADEQLARWIYRRAAEALLADDDGAAFTAAAPRLDAASSQRRAGALLSALEHRLAAYHAGALATAPDRRWRPACEALIGAADEELNVRAQLTSRAFATIAGEPLPPTLRTVELGEGDDPPFPLFVAGFGVGFDMVVDDQPLPPGTPEGLSVFEDQFGGLACLHERMVGYAIPLPPVISASEAWGRLCSVWRDTQGEEMTAPDRAEWHAALAPLLPLPPLTHGFEALIWTAPCEPCDVLGGLDVLAFGRRVPWRRRIDLSVDANFERAGQLAPAHGDPSATPG
jgi:hypothetical protein